MATGVIEATTTEWIVGLTAIVVFFVLYGVMLLVRRRPSEAPGDGQRWSQSAAEPWGTIALTGFFLLPLVLALTRALGAGWLTAPVLAGGFGALWVLLGGSDQLRELAVSEDAVEWRTIRRRHRVPIDYVVAVTDPVGTGHPPEVWFSDGSVLQLPETGGVLAVARTLACRIGQPWSW